MYKSWESLVTLQLPSDCWDVFWTNESEKQDTISFCTSLLRKETGPIYGQVTWHGRKRDRISLCGNVTWKGPKGKESRYVEMSRDNDQKRCVYKIGIAAPKSFFNIHSQELFTSFSYQHSISFTHGLQNYCFLGQANLYRLHGLWQRPRQIGTFLLVQKWLKKLGCKTQSFQERWQERIPTGIKTHNGRGTFQPVYAIEEPTGHCSRKLYWRWKLVHSADTYNVRRESWTTHTGSQGGWRTGPSEQKDFCDSVAVQCGQTKEF